jgi:hypothetical protein
LLNYAVRVIRVTEKMLRSIAEAEELIRIFTASIRTTQRNRPTK